MYGRPCLLRASTVGLRALGHGSGPSLAQVCQRVSAGGMSPQQVAAEFLILPPPRAPWGSRIESRDACDGGKR